MSKCMMPKDLPVYDVPCGDGMFQQRIWENKFVDADGIVYNEYGQILGYGELKDNVFFMEQGKPKFISDPSDEQEGHRILV